jgi:tetratricopeptide (TPR) repeat protein
VAKTLNNLGAAYSNLEQPDRAIGYVRQAAALAERTLGADHPQLAEPLVNLSKLLRVQGQLGEAERAGRRALAIKEAAYGPWAPPTLNARIHVAFTLACQGHFPEALAMQDATVAAARKNGRESLTALFFQLGGRGQVRHWVGDDRGALDDLVEAAALARKMYGAEGMALGRALMDLALQQVVSGEPGAAETLAQAKAAAAAVPQPSPHFDRMAALVAASLKLARGEDVAATEAQLRALIQALSASTDPAQQHLARDGEAILARPR